MIEKAIAKVPFFGTIIKYRFAILFFIIIGLVGFFFAKDHFNYSDVGKVTIVPPKSPQVKTDTKNIDNFLKCIEKRCKDVNLQGCF